MTRAFIQTAEFSRNWDRLGFDDEDLRLLELDIMKHQINTRLCRGLVDFVRLEWQ